MSKFNPITATPDDIAEFVKSLSDEELRNSLVHSFLQMRNINAEYAGIINNYKMAFDALELAIEKGEIISVRNAIKEVDDLIEENTNATLRINNEIEELKRKRE